MTDILALLGAGATFDEILADFQELERDDIFAALNCAAEKLDSNEATV